MSKMYGLFNKLTQVRKKAPGCVCVCVCACACACVCLCVCPPLRKSFRITTEAIKQRSNIGFDHILIHPRRHRSSSQHSPVLRDGTAKSSPARPGNIQKGGLRQINSKKKEFSKNQAHEMLKKNLQGGEERGWATHVNARNFTWPSCSMRLIHSPVAT